MKLWLSKVLPSLALVLLIFACLRVDQPARAQGGGSVPSIVSLTPPTFAINAGCASALVVSNNVWYKQGNLITAWVNFSCTYQASAAQCISLTFTYPSGAAPTTFKYASLGGVTNTASTTVSGYLLVNTSGNWQFCTYTSTLNFTASLAGVGVNSMIQYSID